MKWMTRGVVLAFTLWTVAGCGGGGGGGGGGIGGIGGGGSNNSGYTPGTFAASSSFANQCAAPRAGTADRSGSAFIESMYLRSWTNELYLWYSEVPDRNPTGTATADYFETLKTSAITASGRPKDQFHFTYTTAEWERLSQSGIEVGYGTQWVVLANLPPRRVVVAFTEPNTPAAAANLPRGAEVLLADGVDVVNGTNSNIGAQLDGAFYPERAGETHTFRIREVSGTVRDITLNSVEVTHQPVLISRTIDQGGVPVGYLLFNDHIATAEAQLFNAITSLRNAGVQDLVLDLRYNGGGFLDLASELGYMIGGNMTVGQTFERSVFNDKHPTTNPVTGQALAPMPFHRTARNFSVPAGTQLPTLNLNRVYILTGRNTCSASEALINGLRGVGIQVHQIGSTTCGKPYGFYPEDNCGTTYFSIQMQGRNAQNFGDYADGFSPGTADAGSVIKGCRVADDFSRPLGDPLEARLQAALAYRGSNNQQCPQASGFAPDDGFSSKPTAFVDDDGELFKSPARTNRLLRE